MTRATFVVAVALAGLAAGAPADAATLEITTTIAAAEATDPAHFQAAVERAVRAAVDEARLEGATRVFTPTLVVVTRAVTIGERVHVRILISDDMPPTPATTSVAPTDI